MIEKIMLLNSTNVTRTDAYIIPITIYSKINFFKLVKFNVKYL